MGIIKTSQVISLCRQHWKHALTPSYTKENWVFVDWVSFVLVTADEFPQKDSFALQNADLTKRNRVRLNLRFKEIWKNSAVVFCGTEIEPRVWQVKVLAGFSPVCQGLRPCSLNDSPPCSLCSSLTATLPSFNRPSSFLLQGFSAGCFLFQECSLLPTHPLPFLKTNKRNLAIACYCFLRKIFLDFPTQLALPGPTIVIIHQHICLHKLLSCPSQCVIMSWDYWLNAELNA